MSGWRILVKQLHEIGGGPARRVEFDTLPTLIAGTQALTRAKQLGLIESHIRGYRWKWTLTDLGRDWCEGRVDIVGVQISRIGGPVLRPVATWLKALPKPGEIKL